MQNRNWLFLTWYKNSFKNWKFTFEIMSIEFIFENCELMSLLNWNSFVDLTTSFATTNANVFFFFSIIDQRQKKMNFFFRKLINDKFFFVLISNLIIASFTMIKKNELFFFVDWLTTIVFIVTNDLFLNAKNVVNANINENEKKTKWYDYDEKLFFRRRYCFEKINIYINECWQSLKHV